MILSDFFNGINSVGNILNRCVFDQEKCAVGIRMLESYRKAWNDIHRKGV